MARRICVVTGSRAEYGLLYWVLRELQTVAEFELLLVVTGAHLAPEFGHTVDEIVRDGFPIARRVEMQLSSDTPAGVARSIALGIVGMSDAIEELQPDIALVLGDRFEILAAVQACLVHNVPVAHIAGGDSTEGAFDESMRHAITKMAHVHFATNTQAVGRLRQLGEDPRHIHLVGSPGLDHLSRMRLLDRSQLADALGRPLGKRNLLVTFHPVTLEPGRGHAQFLELLGALDGLDQDIMVWFTHPNADTGGRALAHALDAWVAERGARACAFTSLGQLRYLSLMAQVDAVVGNSSSGLYEAPSLRVPTVNIGDRQRGRLMAESVLQCVPLRSEILAAIEKAMALDCSGVTNPYGDGRSARRIVDILRQLPAPAEMLKKHFHALEAAHG